jgi:crotonobetainyl-CoA:carnitine CoA-transferase CaiB-like acyl-CoA transferase
MDEARPFAGIEVVEFGQFIAAPYCAQLLADGGAHVIKVEALEGDPVRQIAPLAPGETRHFLSRNRGKHTLPLQLRHTGAAPVLGRLLARADVVLTNFRPGLAAELGLDYTSLAPRYPRLIVGNVSAFGARGPDAGLAGMDLVVQARSGLMAANGRLQGALPVAGDPPAADYMCAMSLAFGVAAALLRRTRTGRGGQVDVSLLMSALVLQNNSMMRVESVDGPVHARLRQRLAEARAAGRPFPEQAALIPQIRTPAMTEIYYRTYTTRDAAIALACASPGLQRALMKAVGLADEAHQRPIGDRETQARHYAGLRVRMEAVMASRTTAEWKEIFDGQGIPAAGVKLPFELFDDDQPMANHLYHDLPHPALGTVRVLSTPVGLDGAGFRPSPPTAPFGSETRALLGDLGFTKEKIEGLLAEGVTRDQLGGPA